MSFVGCEGGLKLMVNGAVGDTLAAPMKYLRLFSNNHTPAESDTAANYTEVTGAGYVAKDLTTGGWNAATYSGGAAHKSHTAETWTFSDLSPFSITIYGYYITDALGGLIGAELRPGGPVTYTTNGDTFTVTLDFSYDNA